MDSAPINAAEPVVYIEPTAVDEKYSEAPGASCQAMRPAPSDVRTWPFVPLVVGNVIPDVEPLIRVRVPDKCISPLFRRVRALLLVESPVPFPATKSLSADTNAEALPAPVVA